MRFEVGKRYEFFTDLECSLQAKQAIENGFNVKFGKNALGVCYFDVINVKQGGWISVKDRLPEEKQESVGGIELISHSDRVIVAVANKDGRRFISDDVLIRGKWYGYGDHVTHWTPFPELPLEENNNEQKGRV